MRLSTKDHPLLVSRQAARAIFAEVRRWVEHGLSSFGTPLESLLYPLSSLLPAAGGELYCPLELVGIDHIDQIIIDDVAIPHDDVKAFSPSNCHFAAADMRRANDEFNAEIEQRLIARPRLGVHSKLHHGTSWLAAAATAVRRWRTAPPTGFEPVLPP